MDAQRKQKRFAAAYPLPRFISAKPGSETYPPDFSSGLLKTGN
jgi:hypothetical protein